MKKRLLAMFALAPAVALAGARVDCHIAYFGDSRIVSAGPTAQPYTVAPVAFERDFLFRLVLRTRPADEAGVTVAVYTPTADGPAMIQQASYPWPPGGGRTHGFTGLQRVFEPVGDAELTYWCEALPGRTRGARR
jgi:hypothetical protein